MVLEEDMLLIEEMYNFEVNFFNFETKHKTHSDYFKIKDCRDYLCHYAPHHIKLVLLRKIDPNQLEEEYEKEAFPDINQKNKISFEDIKEYNKTIKGVIKGEYIEQKFDNRIYHIFLFECELLKLEDTITFAIHKHNIDNKKIFDFDKDPNLRTNSAMEIKDKIQNNEQLKNHLCNIFKTKGADAFIESYIPYLNKEASKVTKTPTQYETLNKKNEQGAFLTLGAKFGLLKEYFKISQQHEDSFNTINSFGIQLRHEDGFKKTANITQDLYEKIKQLDNDLSLI